MLERKEIFLWVYENKQLVRKPFLNINLKERKKHIIDQDLLKKHWFNRSKLKPSTFAKEFLSITDKLKTTFRKVINREYQLNPYCKRNINLEEEIIKIEISFADNNIFKKLTESGFKIDEEDNKEEVFASACFNEREGIIISESETRTLKYMYTAFLHEYGHALDYLLNPCAYYQKTATMGETMAILTQEEFNTSREHTTSLHSRAQNLLRMLNCSDFKELDFADRWIYLSNIIDHKKGFNHFLEDFKFKKSRKSIRDYLWKW